MVKFKIHGQENLPRYPQAPAVIVMNHSSSLDIPLAEIVTGSYPHVWVSKREYQKIPLLGFLLKRMHVMVDTQSRKDSHLALLSLLKLLKGGPRHALIFPEGTRHSDGNIHELQPGFAIVAQKLKRPIIPVAIIGAHRVLPKKGFLIDSCNASVTITIGTPIPYHENMNLDDVVTTVRRYYEKTLAQIDQL